MSAAKTAKLLNGLLDSQKTDRARLKLLEGRLAEADTRQAAAVTAAATAAEMQFKAQLERVQQERAVEHVALKAHLERVQQARAVEQATRTALVATKDRQITELADTKDWQITELRQELSGARQLLAAADTSNEELRGTVEALGDNLDKATHEAVKHADERAEIAKQREALNHLLDDVRGHMRKKDLQRESAILNRQALAGAAPRVNFK
jgi:chromosome segregation ATPase